MLENNSHENVDIFHRAAKLFDDFDVFQNNCKVFEEKVYDTTKAPGFFRNTLPLAKDENVHFEAAPELIMSYLKKMVANVKKELLQLESYSAFIDSSLGIIRYLIQEVKEIFNLIIPEEIAKFSCSLDLVPPKGNFWKFNKMCSKGSIRSCYACPEKVNNCELLPKPSKKSKEIFEKYGDSMDASTFRYKDVKELFVEYSSDL